MFLLWQFVSQLIFLTCDVLLHSAQKRTLRTFPALLRASHIFRDWQCACDKVCHDRLIQRCFFRALCRDARGDIDESLIPDDTLAWYKGSADAGQEEKAVLNGDKVKWSFIRGF